MHFSERGLRLASANMEAEVINIYIPNSRFDSFELTGDEMMIVYCRAVALMEAFHICLAGSAKSRSLIELTWASNSDYLRFE